jgi:hypothetical protein
MAKQKVIIEGIEYDSRTAAARVMVASGKSLNDAAKATGMTYQTVYANTTGKDKVKSRKTAYRILSLGRSGNKTVDEIAKKTGRNVCEVINILSKNNLQIVTRDLNNNSKSNKKITSPVNLLIPDEDYIMDIPEDLNAKAIAEADMISA